jgi:hypothetical protein
LGTKAFACPALYLQGETVNHREIVSFLRGVAGLIRDTESIPLPARRKILWTLTAFRQACTPPSIER